MNESNDGRTDDSKTPRRQTRVDVDGGVEDDAVRLTAYFLWQQEGRPRFGPRKFWDRAVHMHRRAHNQGQQLEAGVTALNRDKAAAAVEGGRKQG
jgi:hypothetical protein